MAILDLQRVLYNLDFPLLAPGRHLLKSGILIKRGRRADEERAFFLFTDMLLYADIQYSWSRAVSSPYLPGMSAFIEPHRPLSTPLNEKSRSSVVWPGSGSSILSTKSQYTFKRKISLTDVNINGSEGCSFEIRSTIKSFSVIAST